MLRGNLEYKMASVMKRHWDPAHGSGLPRRDRQGCEYAAYVPDPLMARRIALDGLVAADVADAEAAVARFNLEAVALADSEALARLLLRAEAVGSSRVEGLEIGARRLLRAEAARAAGDEPSDVTAEEILGNISAMAWATESVANADVITVEHLLEIHRRLLAGTRLAERGGRIRVDQNWIGGSSFNPCSATFIPPPPEQVPALLEDLCTFCNQDGLPAIAQAAIAHAQFETIHPFDDGNGRTGRALIHVVLRRRGLAPRVLPPVSLILATWAADYVSALTDTRYVGDASSPAAHDGLNRWVALFATATRRAVTDVEAYEEEIRLLRTAWRARLGQVRRNSATDLLLSALPGTPIITVGGAVQLIHRTFQATNAAMTRLVEAGVLTQVKIGRRNRAFEAPELIEAFTNLERRAASPAGDAQASPPSRLTPRR
jgi:Fic family protein